MLTARAAAQVLGERMVLAANGAGGVATVALRPSGIFGERDPLLVPLTVAKARQGKMRFVIGSGANLMDFTYVVNVAQAHVLVSLSSLAHAAALGWLGVCCVGPSLQLCPLSSVQLCPIQLYPRVLEYATVRSC